MGIWNHYLLIRHNIDRIILESQNKFILLLRIEFYNSLIIHINIFILTYPPIIHLIRLTIKIRLITTISFFRPLIPLRTITTLIFIQFLFPLILNILNFIIIINYIIKLSISCLFAIRTEFITILSHRRLMFFSHWKITFIIKLIFFITTVFFKTGFKSGIQRFRFFCLFNIRIWLLLFIF